MSRLKKGDLIVTSNYTPYIRAYNIRNGETSIAYGDNVNESLSGTVNDIAFSPDGRYTYIASDSNARFTIIDNLDFSERTHNLTFTDKCEAVAVSPDGLWIALGFSNDDIIIINASTLAQHAIINNPTTTTTTEGLRFSPDSLTLIASLSKTPYITSYDVPTFVPSGVTFSGHGKGHDVYFIDNNLFSTREASYVKIVNKLTGTLEDVTIVSLGTDTCSPVSPDKSKLITHTSNTLNVHDITNLDAYDSWEIRSGTNISSTIIRADWLDSENIITTHNYSTVAMQMTNIISGETKYMSYQPTCYIIGVMRGSNYIQDYKVSGTIDENMVNEDWLITAYTDMSGIEVNEIEFNGAGVFEINVPTSDNVMVTVRQKPIPTWTHSTNYNVDDLVTATDPNGNPYYYKCTTAGITSATEPTWNNVQSSSTVDATVVWNTVERLVMPVTHSPLKPIPA